MAKITPIDILKVVSNKYTLVTNLLCVKHTLLAKQAYFPQRANLHPKYTTWDIHPYRLLKNGCSPRPNRSHNRVIRLVWWHT